MGRAAKGTGVNGAAPSPYGGYYPNPVQQYHPSYQDPNAYPQQPKAGEYSQPGYPASK
jgi:hypothetical protein